MEGSSRHTGGTTPDVDDWDSSAHYAYAAVEQAYRCSWQASRGQAGTRCICPRNCDTKSRAVVRANRVSSNCASVLAAARQVFVPRSGECRPPDVEKAGATKLGRDWCGPGRGRKCGQLGSTRLARGIIRGNHRWRGSCWFQACHQVCQWSIGRRWQVRAASSVSTTQVIATQGYQRRPQFTPMPT